MCCSAADLVATVARAEGDPSWLPLAVGNSWSYRSENDVQYKYPDRPIVRRFWVGRMSERVADSAAPPEGGLTLYTVIRDAREPVEVGTHTFSRRIIRGLSTGSAGLRLHAIQVPDAAPPLNQAVRYAEPLELLRAGVAAGSSWKVGTWVLGNLAVELTATAVARQEVVVPSGTWADALVVRYEGPVSGMIEAAGEWAVVDSGRYERTWWLAPGVGIVKERVEIRFQGMIGEERSIDGHIRSERDLLEHTLAAP